MAPTATADEVHRVVSTAVDAAFYQAVYPELDRPGFDPIRHYADHGWREGRDPAPWFSVRRYLEVHRDVAASGVEPLSHYLLHGAREGRAVFASRLASRYRAAPEAARSAPAPSRPAPAPTAARATESERTAVADAFDAAYYLAVNPDIAEAEVDPLDHFLEHGWREGRDPCAQFSVRDYLEANPDVAAAGVNPFAHYLISGRAEGRAPRSTLGFRHRMLTRMVPLDARIAEAETAAARVEGAPPEALAAALADSRSDGADLHVTFSHDDYTVHIGGVQLCLQHEAARIAELGRDHLHLCPVNGWPVLRTGERAPLCVIWNGRRVGAFAPEAVAAALRARIADRPGRRSFAIHNLLGHQVDEVLAIVRAAGLQAGFLWLHEYTSLCSGYQLLRNDVEDCGAPPPDSAACGICIYGERRGVQLREHERLFRELRLTVVSPSRHTLDFWRRSATYPTAGEVVQPHVRLAPAGPAPASPGPLRVAFLGMPSAHKGWPVFAELAERFAGDPRYEFLHLGSRAAPGAAIAYHPVTVTAAEPLAMQRAIEALNVDVAMIWSLFRETFCFAAYEAVAGGAAIVTWPDSGNVAAFVEHGGHGRVLAGEAALAAAFERGELLGLARASRKPQLYRQEFSRMTADLLETSVAE
jgi:hypothetical protein